MSQITIIQDDGIVGVDGVFRSVDLAKFDDKIHAVQFDTVAGAGWVEFKPSAGMPNQDIGQAMFDKRFERFVQAWRAAGEPPVRSLDEIKADARAQINSQRDTREAAGFPYLGKVFDSDPRSAQRISLAVLSAQAALQLSQPFQLNWTAQDNSQLTLDAAGMIGMPVALAMNAAALHVAAREFKDRIDAASTAGEVEAILVEAGAA